MTDWTNPRYALVYLDVDDNVVEVEITDSPENKASGWCIGDRMAGYPTAVAVDVYEMCEKRYLVGRRWSYFGNRQVPPRLGFSI
jgi:hypothetical protein